MFAPKTAKPTTRQRPSAGGSAKHASEPARPIGNQATLRQRAHPSPTPDVADIVAQGLSGPGQPLPAPLRAEWEPEFGVDLSDTRIHTNKAASLSAARLSARAYTVGSDIAFRDGAYAPGTADGKRLLAHELAHVAQGGNEAVVRREDAPYSENPPVANATPDYSQMSWQDLLPRASGAKGKQIAKIDLHTPGNDFNKRGTGAAPTLNYAADKDINTQPAPVTPQGGVSTTPQADAKATAQNTDLKTAQDMAIAQIVAARSKIPVHAMPRSINNNAGYDYDPTKDPAAADYNKWIKDALPAGVKATDWNWQVFKKIQGLEGQEGRFTTFDKTLSVGPGFSSSGGQTQLVLGKTFKLLPGVKSVALAAGLIIDEFGNVTVVDTDKKWILAGQDAMAYLQTETSLLSLLVNISQGIQPVGPDATTVAPDEQSRQRQALLETEWKQFLNVTLSGITSLVRGWPIDSAVLAVHAKHAQPGNFPYSFWSGANGPALKTMVDAISAKVGDSAKFICSGMYAGYL